MIVRVSSENEKAWAELCAAMWPHQAVNEFLRKRRDGKNEDEFLYFIGDEAVAFLSLAVRNDYVEGTRSSPVGYIEGIYVKPEVRGKGVARALVEFAKEWSREWGCLELASDCIITNEASRSFHNRVGFKEANVLVCFTMDVE